MDFLGIGLPELIVIIILALIFIGPRDMPQMAGRAAKFLRDLRMMSEGFTTEWRREITAATRVDELEELKSEYEATKKSFNSVKNDLIGVANVDLSQVKIPTKSSKNVTKNSIAPPKKTPNPSQNSTTKTDQTDQTNSAKTNLTESNSPQSNPTDISQSKSAEKDIPSTAIEDATTGD